MFQTLRSRILTVSGIVFLVMLGITSMVLARFNLAQTLMLQQTEEQAHAGIARLLEEEMEKALATAATGARSVAANPEIQEMFARRDRDRLLQVCLPIYEKLKMNGISQFQFHTPHLICAPSCASISRNSLETISPTARPWLRQTGATGK